MKISFLGLGRMGRILADHLVDDGHELVVWNRTTAATRAFDEAGVGIASSAKEAIESSPVVVSALFGPDAVREAIVGADASWQPGAIWIDITTIAPNDTREFGAWAREAGIGYVHAPVIGTLGPAHKRALGVPFGGDASAMEQAREVVESWADPQQLFALDSAPKAATAKLIANLALAVTVQGVIEALRLGRAEDLNVDDVLSSLEHTALAGMLQMKGAVVRSGSYADTQFSTDLLAKDVALMLQTSSDPMPALAAALESLQSAQQAGHGDDDFSVAIRPESVGADSVDISES